MIYRITHSPASQGRSERDSRLEQSVRPTERATQFAFDAHRFAIAAAEMVSDDKFCRQRSRPDTPSSEDDS